MGQTMPRRKSPPRLYLDRKRAQWVIRDGQSFIRTGVAATDVDRAEKALGEYLADKYEPKAAADPFIADVLAAYSRDLVPHMRSASSVTYFISALDRWWGERRVTEINSRTCRAYASTRPPSSGRSELEKLAAALQHWHKEYGPLHVIPSLTMPPKPAPRDRWLTKPEAARLLWAARRTPHLARFILLGLYTGSRSGMLRELEWSWLDLDAGIMRRRAAGKADNATKRRPPVRLGRRIIAHLRRWKRLDKGRCQWVVHYNGAPIKDAFRTSWGTAIKRARLKGVTPHTLRHTRATWMMQAGVHLWQAAGALGMSVKVLEAVYGHHHPDWQKDAANV